jgi:hypothetical protein
MIKVGVKIKCGKHLRIEGVVLIAFHMNCCPEIGKPKLLVKTSDVCVCVGGGGDERRGGGSARSVAKGQLV